jgi:hypothetical protein
VLLLASSAAAAGDLPRWVENTEIGGYFFGDAYWVAAHHDPAIEDENGFWFRRAYLRFDTRVSDAIDVRVQFEANSPGDFGATSENLEPYLKDLWVRWRFGRSEIWAGLAPSVTWDLVEAHWGYRHVEKTPPDLYRWGSSRDIGLAVRGDIDRQRRVRYHVMLGNGEGTRNETDDGKKVMASLSFHPAAAWSFEVQGDHDDRPGTTDRATGQAFAGYRTERGRLGLQYLRQVREVEGGEDLELDVASIYGVLQLTPQLKLVSRIDRNFDPIPDGDAIDYIAFDTTAESTFALLGFDIALHEQIDLIPNVEAVFYDSLGAAGTPDDDLIARATLFVRF